MYLMLIKSVFPWWIWVLTLSAIINVTESQNSPCPRLFNYYRDSTNNDVIFGRIVLPNPKYGSHKLEVTLSVKARPNSYGRIVMLNEQDIKNNVEGEPYAIYRIDFPLLRPIPKLTRLVFRGQLLCTGQPEIASGVGQFVTAINLQHVFNLTKAIYPFYRPTNQEITNLQLNNYDIETDTDYVEIQRPTTTTRRPTTRRTTPRPIIYNNNENCGRRVDDDSDDTVSLIVNGYTTEKGDWPWAIAVFQRDGVGFSFICTGNLISKNLVVSAAHCTHVKKMKRDSSLFLIRIGVHNIQEWDDDNEQTRRVSEIIYPPNYNETDPTINDIIVMVLTKPVRYTHTVQPICLWSGDNISRGNGIVVGWGRDENGLQSVPEPRFAEVYIASHNECIISNEKFKRLINKYNFCAGARDVGPCTGDSGGGLYMKRGDHYELKGIVSKSLRSQDSNRNCDLNNFVLYTDAAKKANWLRQLKRKYDSQT